MAFEILAIVVLLAIVILLYLELNKIRKELSKTKSSKHSQSTKYGQIFEELVPFAKNFPGDPKNFKFIGKPIDGILFSDDEIKFIEIKMANSSLTAKQKHIKDLVQQKKVSWEEVRGK